MLSGLLFDRLTADSSPVVLFKTRRCLRARFSSNTCQNCVEECQSGALTITGKAITFEPEKCSGCLRCTAVCPNDALTDSIDMDLLLETVSARKKVVLSCGKGRQCEGKIKIPCIGFLSEPLLAAINILANDSIILDVEKCGDCKNGHALPVIEKRVSNILNQTSGDLPLKIKLAFKKEDLPGIDKKKARRYFLKEAGKTIIDITVGEAVIEESEQTKSPVRCTMALNYALEQTTDKMNKELIAPYIFDLDVSDKCTHCPLCSGMCPTGALKREKKQAIHQLVFDSARCSGCALCVEFCKKDALTLLPGAEKS